ncbi:HNH endonuclease [Ferrimonas lipolytica]|uniref:HNH endonuclease n=1 Tax=Ferrimonas lipolytica TaxID=2724191 RepID=A0A6H1UG36_9GAMM|nr:hypothetical protein [Ferrimonas lipolytica]QIZ78065.1 hypothetical protein HER31_14865 [Ferrimonas lipolytica]
MAKLPGKTAYSGVRRTTTRKSGFKSHPDSTGGEYKTESVTPILLEAGKTLTFVFNFPRSDGQTYVGFGGFYQCEDFVQITFNNPNSSKNEFSRRTPPDTSKFGSMWIANGLSEPVTISFNSEVDTYLAIYNFECGLIWHEAFDAARENDQTGYLNSMHSIMPEAGFYTEDGQVSFNYESPLKYINPNINLHLKSCNRCARFLPINLNNERETLAFSNHCVAKAPCTHKGFGLLTNIDTGEAVDLHYGYQLECRFCKKYFVNMPLNWQRTAAQMKEDGQRRRNFELLIAEIYQQSPQLSYRTQTGRELLDDVWSRFKGQCFNCNNPIQNKRKMHLDHTRPLALLWPLDGTATALCATCNTSKRDRPPSQFYSPQQLNQLSLLTGLSVEELTVPEPNHEVIKELLARLDWLYEDFLTKPALLMERDGKITAELVVKALDKVLRRSQQVEYDFSFVNEYNRRRDSHITFDINEDTDSVV